VIDIRKIEADVADRMAQDAAVADRAAGLRTRLDAVEEEIYQVRNQSNQDPLNYPIKLNNKIAALMGAVEGVHGAPTAQSYIVFQELSQRLDAQLQALDRVITSDLAAFNELLRSRNLEPIADPRSRPTTD
jgi:kynureninase